MQIFDINDPLEQRADRLKTVLDAFDWVDCLVKFSQTGQEAQQAGEQEDADMFFGYARVLTHLNDWIDDVKKYGVSNFSPTLLVNASSPEEALCVLTAAVRQGVAYADGVPDWRRGFLESLEENGTYVLSDDHERDQRLQSENDFEAMAPKSMSGTVPLTEDAEAVTSNGRVWIRNSGEYVCFPAVKALRITPKMHASKGYGSLHCFVERALNFNNPQDGHFLTKGGYLSQSRAWDHQAKLAESLSISPAPKGDVPEFHETAASSPLFL